jgi:hypothetical protein
MSLDDALAGARFLGGLPSFLRHPVALEEAAATLRRRLAQREADFLDIARRAIYQQAHSPYRRMLEIAGCEYGDLERLVRQGGLEGALQALYRSGVYLTVDEFKGRRPAVRGGIALPIDPARLQNPCSAFHIPARSSGSRGPGTAVQMDLAFVRDRALTTSLVLDARGGGGWLKAVWGVPGSWGMVRLLELSGFGAPAARWFSQIDPDIPDLHPRYRWSMRALGWGSRLAGVPLPRAQHAPLDDPLPLASWMAEVLRRGGTPYLQTFASPAVRLCQAAMRAGLDLRDAQLTISGEPITAARLAVIRGAGAEAQPCYAITECGPIGYGCLAPEAADDLHLLHDRHGLIQAGPEGEALGLPPMALLLTSLRPTSPFILLNVSMGDQAVVARRACGCPLERLGWARHLHTIRSYEKLTGGGVNFLDTDVIRVLEEVLPARFGGAPTDYQLLEEEAADGRPQLRLLVHPGIGPLVPAAVAEAFLEAIGGGTGAERVMGLMWREAGLLQVERRAPLATRSGKVLHLHLDCRLPPGRGGKDGEREGRKT